MMPEIQAVVLLALAVYVYVTRADFERYSIFSVGRAKRIHRLKAGMGECAECGESVEAGEHRVAATEYVVAGFPVFRRQDSRNTYCGEHVSFEFKRQLDDEPGGLTQAAAKVVAWFSTDAEPAQAHKQTQFSNVTAGVSDALRLAPVALLVLFVAMCASILKPLK